MIGNISKEDMLKALGKTMPQAESGESTPVLTLKGIAETVTHNANVAQRVSSDLAAEITMTNLVVKHIMRKLELDPQEIVNAATEELASLSQSIREDVSGDLLPPEATIFGG